MGNEVDNDIYVSSSLKTQNGTSYINILFYSRFILGIEKLCINFQEILCAISKFYAPEY
jgi:hypothetical protein